MTLQIIHIDDDYTLGTDVLKYLKSVFPKAHQKKLDAPWDINPDADCPPNANNNTIIIADLYFPTFKGRIRNELANCGRCFQKDDGSPHFVGEAALYCLQKYTIPRLQKIKEYQPNAMFLFYSYVLLYLTEQADRRSDETLSHLKAQLDEQLNRIPIDLNEDIILKRHLSVSFNASPRHLSSSEREMVELYKKTELQQIVNRITSVAVQCDINVPNNQ